jgi:acetolactate synthase small subunit
MAGNDEGHWLFVIKADDRPGVAASIAFVFSGRGVQIESFIGYGSAQVADENEAVLGITCRTFERRMEMVRRVLERLEDVREVSVYDYENDERLVKSALARVRTTAKDLDELLTGIQVTHQVVAVVGDVLTVVIYGKPVNVDLATDKLADEKLLISSVYTISPPA